MAVTTQADVTKALRAMGWRTRTSAETTRSIKDYQGGYNLTAALEVDGIAGPATKAALTRSMAAGGALSAHFKAAEFACRCGGKYSACRRIWVTRAQLRALETYRAKAGPVSIVSGCRCPTHNKTVGGASASQHMAGKAADVPGALTVASVKALRVFSGIGYKGSTGRVVHVDTRPGSTTAPTTWVYS
jgi:zinc D-Ala-D-Ala carboxypeptidase